MIKVGTKFTHYCHKYDIFTISKNDGYECEISWMEGKIKYTTSYSIRDIERYFKEGTWVEVSLNHIRKEKLKKLQNV